MHIGDPVVVLNGLRNMKLKQHRAFLKAFSAVFQSQDGAHLLDAGLLTTFPKELFSGTFTKEQAEAFLERAVALGIPRSELDRAIQTRIELMLINNAIKFIMARSVPKYRT